MDEHESEAADEPHTVASPRQPARRRLPFEGVDTRLWSLGAQRTLWFVIGVLVGFGGLCAVGVMRVAFNYSIPRWLRGVGPLVVIGGVLVLQLVVVSRSRRLGPQVRWRAYLIGWLAPLFLCGLIPYLVLAYVTGPAGY